MEKIPVTDRAILAPLFAGWEETLIWSCLQGHLGLAWADSGIHPQSARLIVGDFCFLAGKPHSGLVQNIPPDFPTSTLIMIPQTEGWSALIEAIHFPNCQRTQRYAIKKEPHVFQPEKLQAYVHCLPEGYSLHPIDEALYHHSKTEAWSQDLCSLFPSYEDYRRHGMGFMVLFGSRPVAGASSYAYYDGGIEIEIDTHRDHRRRGLALACGAKLILACLEKGLYPSWDAHNPGSVALAEKLGYHLDRPYCTYLVSIDEKQAKSPGASSLRF